MLEMMIEKLKLNGEDTLKSALLKGVGVGVLEGLVIVGAIHTASNIIRGNK